MRLSGHSTNSNGITLSKVKLSESISNCKKIIGKSLYKLYDMGYIPSSTVFNSRSFIRALYEEYEDEVGLLDSTLEGVLDMSSLRVKYAYTVSSNDKFKEVMKVLYEYFLNTENLNALEKTLQSSLMKSGDDFVNAIPKVLVSESVVKYRCPLMLSNSAVRDCLAPNSVITGESCKLVEYNFSEIVLEGLCGYLGISFDEFSKAKYKDESLFFTGISFKEELEFISLLASGDVELDTKNGKLLRKAVFEYYTSTVDAIGSSYDTQSFGDMIYIRTFLDRMNYVKRLRDELGSSGFKEYLVTTNSIYFEVPSSNSKTDAKSFDWSIVGNYVLDWSRGIEFSKVNNLLGVSGEFISSKDCRKHGFKKSGTPTMIKNLELVNGVLSVTEESYYNISQLTTSEDNPVEPLVGKSFEFVFTDISEVCRRFSTDRDGLLDVFEHRFRSVFGIMDYKYVKLVADLCLALVLMDCGYPDYTSSIVDKSFITEELFYKACYDAENLFRVLDL